MFPDQTVVMPILDASTFWPIQGEESYHQDFYKKAPERYQAYVEGSLYDPFLESIWGPVEDLQAGAAGLSLRTRECLAQDLLGQTLLAVLHQLDHETIRGARERRRVLDLARDLRTSGHYLGLLVP